MKKINQNGIFISIIAVIMFLTNPSKADHEMECKRAFKQELKTKNKSQSKLEKTVENAMINLLATPVIELLLAQAEYQNYGLFSVLWVEDSDENGQSKKKWISLGIFATVFMQIDQNDL